MARMKSLFAGGIHPTHGEDKALTAGKEIKVYIPAKVCISMKQGLGPACKPVVAAGDEVQQGQLIGQAGHFLSADVFASVTGTVLSVSDAEVVIEVKACTLPDKEADYYKAKADVAAFTREELVDLLKAGGLVGMGGAGFPTAAKYATKEKITHLLINGSECEPYLTCDEHLMLEQGMAILNGVLALKKACGADRAVICMEDNKAHCKAALDALLGAFGGEIEVQLLPTRYPQGGEKQLIKAVMGVEIPSGQLPAQVGAMVSNIHTAKAAADMIFGKIPCMSRVITITGDVKEPGNYQVPVGTNIGELVRQAGDVVSKENKVVLGGPMTGRCLGFGMDADAISANGACVSKVSGGLLVLAGYHPEESACIKCGSCAAACPIGLKPAAIDHFHRTGNIEKLKGLKATECIACGCCSYVCPAKRELTFHTTGARDAVRARLREEAQKNAK